MRSDGLCGCGLLALVLVLWPAAGHGQAVAAAPAVEFPTSCSTGVAAAFNRAVTLLHSFEYSAAEAAFRGVLVRDPGCAMARWGVAMTLWHPLWAPPDAEALAAGARLLGGIDPATLSSRERAYVDALAQFYADHERERHDTRALAYQRRMRELYAEHLDDPEAAVFFALALLASADPGDKTYGHQFEAAALLTWVRGSHPRHPGVLHYLIHAFDYPGLAHLGLEAALIYADAAPDSAHAQHMPSHIFTRLGLWERSIASNHDSTASAAAYTVRAGLPGHYDEGLHSIDYLVYALLQMARDDEAGRVLSHLHGLGKAHPENFKVAYTYAASPARFALERRAWREASTLALTPADFPWEAFTWAKSIHHFARGIGAARSGQTESARRELQEIRRIADALPPGTLQYWREEVLVHGDALAGWIALADGDPARALALAEAAAAREDAVDKHPVTPGEVLPARELYADMLLKQGRAEPALAAYRAVLRGSPNRTNALLGAARAATAAGDSAAAERYYRQVWEQTGADASPQREGVREARRHLSAAP